MSASLTAFAYLVASVLFVLALRGLSGPRSARIGNQLGMAGMAIAVAATLLQRGMSGSGLGHQPLRQMFERAGGFSHDDLALIQQGHAR